MTKSTSITVADHFAEFVERQIDEGRYGSPRDVVQAGLQLLEAQEAKLHALRTALIEGEQSGPGAPFDFDAFVQRKRQARKGSK